MLYTNKALLIIIVLGLGACTGIPTAPSSSLPMVPPQISKDYKSASAAFNAKQYKKAIKLFTAIVKKYPESTLCHTNLGLLYLEQNRPDLANRHFAESLKLTPGNPIAHNHQGIIYRQRGDFKQALTSYQRAISLKPDYANAHLNLAILYDLYLHDLSLALQHYQQYQLLSGNTDKLVAKWIIDNQRRLTTMSNGDSK